MNCCGVKPMSAIIAVFELRDFAGDAFVEVCICISLVVAGSRLCEVVAGGQVSSSRQVRCTGEA